MAIQKGGYSMVICDDLNFRSIYEIIYSPGLWVLSFNANKDFGKNRLSGTDVGTSIPI